MSDDRIEALLAQMTREEKLAMTTGDGMWHVPGVPRLGIGRLKVTDGPNGARGDGLAGAGLPTLCVPCGTALAATWDVDLVQRVGEVLAAETKAKGAHVLLAPTVNIHRSPLAGRNFECYSEDPYLSAQMATAYIRGVQSRDVAACVKHYVCNDSEFERHTISSEVSERALREIYLPPFAAAVRDAGAWMVMAAYNRINGIFACEHAELVRSVLKDEWGFDGVVVSDWLANQSGARAMTAGLDLEMPGPGAHFGAHLREALEDGTLAELVLDDTVRRLLRLWARTGALDASEEPPERCEDIAAHRTLAREAAAAGFVLLENEGGVLPLAADALERVAVIGPNAQVAMIQGGGSSQVRAHPAPSPLAALKERLGDRVVFAPGGLTYRLLPLVDPTRLRIAPDGAPGLRVEYFATPDLSDDPVHVDVTDNTKFNWIGSPVPGAVGRTFSVRVSGVFTPDLAGRYAFGLTSVGPSRLSVDGGVLVDLWTERTPGGDSFFGFGCVEERGEIELDADRPVSLVLEYSSAGAELFSGMQVGATLLPPDDAMEQAEAVAAASDVALLFVGLNHDWETEGRDRESLALPGRQVELIERVAAANPRTVVIVNAGAPVSMDWADRVPAIVQMWYPGQEAGPAIADVLLGVVNPSGKLPTTVPRRLEDTPSFLDYPGENGRVHYGEQCFVGYRHYDARKIVPQFCFGHGLSYTSFEYGPLRLARDAIHLDEPVELTVTITNTGARAGAEVVQCYVADLESSLRRPEQELKAFRKLHLEPGETQTVTITLDAHALAFWHPGVSRWVVEPGAFEVRVGSSSRDLRGWAPFRVVEDAPPTA